jgi:hypothetical protein
VFAFLLLANVMFELGIKLPPGCWLGAIPNGIWFFYPAYLFVSFTPFPYEGWFSYTVGRPTNFLFAGAAAGLVTYFDETRALGWGTGFFCLVEDAS